MLHGFSRKPPHHPPHLLLYRYHTNLTVAHKHNLPVIIHNREAGNDVYDILSERIPDSGAILHCYSENAEYAKRCLDMNIYFSFAGNLT